MTMCFPNTLYGYNMVFSYPSFMPSRCKNEVTVRIINYHNDICGGALPKKSVTLSVTARDALMRALSLSSYFIFISKNPEGNKRL